MSVLISKGKPNPLLVGLAGVGKTRIVEDIARRIVQQDSSVPKALADSIIYELPLSHLIAGTAYVGSLEERLKRVIEFATDPRSKAVIFIDEIHQIVSGASRSLDKIGQILKPALARGDLRTIGATTTTEVKDFDRDPAFSRRFSRIIVDELTVQQTIEIIASVNKSLMKHYNLKNLACPLTVTDQVLERVPLIADQYSTKDQSRPDNAITLLDRAYAEAIVTYTTTLAQAEKDNNTALVTVLRQQTAIPVTENMLINTAQKLLTGHAQQAITSRDELCTAFEPIKGQDEAIGEIIDAVIRDRMNIFPRTRPLAWLLPGASGSGKTETAKILAQILTHEKPIVINMTEYVHSHSLNKLLGSPTGYIGSNSHATFPFDSLSTNPYRVILLDEFEKAHPEVQQIFMQAIDEGKITDNRNTVLDFSKALIIATTNAGAEYLTKPPLGFGAQQQAVDSKAVKKALESVFKSELIARFSRVIPFNTLTKDNYRDILRSVYAARYQQLATDAQHYLVHLPVTLDDDVVETITQQHYLASQGARSAHRAIDEYIERCIVDAITF